MTRQPLCTPKSAAIAAVLCFGVCAAAAQSFVGPDGGGVVRGAFNALPGALDGNVGQNGPDLDRVDAGISALGASLSSNGADSLDSRSFANGAGASFRTQGAATTFSGLQFDSGTVALTALCSSGRDCAPAGSIPEPRAYALMFAGLAAVGFVVRRRRQS